MKALLAHPGTQHAPRLAGELAKLDLLQTFHTGIGWTVDSLHYKSAKAIDRVFSSVNLSRRTVPSLKKNQLRTHFGTEIKALIKLRQGGDSLRILHERNLRFQQQIPDSDLKAADVIIGFDTSSWILSQRGLSLDRPLWLDRTIAHPRVWSHWQAKLHQLYPAWCAAPHPRPEWLAEAELIEHRDATRILVGSKFAALSLESQGVPSTKIIVNPYGVDWARFSLPKELEAHSNRNNRPLRFLFVGTICARKGIPLLLDAWRRLEHRRGDAELWIAGRCAKPLEQLLPELPGLKILGQVPKGDMANIYQQCDVLVLPSFLEGFALVILESLAAGLMCITTANSGAGEVLKNPKLAREIPVGDVEALHDSLAQTIDSPPNRDEVINSMNFLREQFSWEAYANRWKRLLMEST